jgi:hypothetical protein
MSGVGYIFLVLFAITLFVMYIAIRRAWASTLRTGGLGAALCLVFAVLFALTRDTINTVQVIVSGIAGLGFAGVVVAGASFFRANQPPAGVRLVSSQEEAKRGQDDHHSETPE